MTISGAPKAAVLKKVGREGVDLVFKALGDFVVNFGVDAKVVGDGDAAGIFDVSDVVSVVEPVSELGVGVTTLDTTSVLLDRIVLSSL